MGGVRCRPFFFCGRLPVACSEICSTPTDAADEYTKADRNTDLICLGPAQLEVGGAKALVAATNTGAVAAFVLQ